jgi:hypothetical protein
MRPLLVAAAIPTLVTLVLAWSGVADVSNGVRAALAVPLGTAIGALIAAVGAGDLR